MSYSEEEKQEFKNRDLRISRQAMLKSLIEKSELEDVNEVNELCELSEKYVKYIYNGLNTCDKDSEQKVSISSEWINAALNSSLDIPEEKHIKVLELIRKKTNLTKVQIMNAIQDEWGKYPTTEKSVDLIVSKIS